MSKDADKVREAAERLAASRGFGAAKIDPEARQARNDAALRERMERSGFHSFDTPEEEAALRQAAERAGSAVRVSSYPQRNP
jgi:L-alanine-DL-glutamate epimerase-like enolase superfamily enzyme